MPVVTQVPSNPQEWLDTILKAFLEGKLPCREGYQCYYRNREDKACVIGLLIPDDQYDPEMDTHWGAVNEVFMEKYGHILPKWCNVTQYREVQRTHDNWSNTLKYEHVVKSLLKCSIFQGLQPSQKVTPCQLS